MQCEICFSELNDNALSCSVCGAPVPQEVEGFNNTLAIQRILYTLVIENFSVKPVSIRSLEALIMDYLTEYQPECRLIIYCIRAGVLKNMILRTIEISLFCVQEAFSSPNASFPKELPNLSSLALPIC